MSDFRFEVTERFGVISQNEESGWKKEFNKVSWNGREPKFDIREWSADGRKMNKGVTFTDSEMSILKDLIQEAI